jgi:hypothetical protein
MRRWSAVAGFVFVVLAFVSRFAEGSVPDPESRAALTRFTDFYRSSSHTRGALVAGAVGVVALFAFVWFLGGLWSLLRDAEGAATAPMIVVVVGGAAFVALGVTSHVLTQTIGITLHFSKGYTVGHGFDAATAVVFNTAGQGAFLGAMVAAGAFLAGASVVILRTRVLPVWLAWLGIAVAVACLPTIPPLSTLAAILLAVWVVAASAFMLQDRQPAA